MEVKTREELNAAIARGRVLVDFWATWCGPCQMMGQKIASELLPQMPDLKVVKVNVDEAPGLAAAFDVMSIPALFCYKDGRHVAAFVGVTDAKEIVQSFA